MFLWTQWHQCSLILYLNVCLLWQLYQVNEAKQYLTIRRCKMFTWEGNKTSDGNKTFNQTQLYRPGTICHSWQFADFSYSVMLEEMLFHLQPYRKRLLAKHLGGNHKVVEFLAKKKKKIDHSDNQETMGINQMWPFPLKHCRRYQLGQFC